MTLNKPHPSSNKHHKSEVYVRTSSGGVKKVYFGCVCSAFPSRSCTRLGGGRSTDGDVGRRRCESGRATQLPDGISGRGCGVRRRVRRRLRGACCARLALFLKNANLGWQVLGVQVVVTLGTFVPVENRSRLATFKEDADDFSAHFKENADDFVCTF